MFDTFILYDVKFSVRRIINIGSNNSLTNSNKYYTPALFICKLLSIGIYICCFSCTEEVPQSTEYVARVGPYTLNRERVDQAYIYRTDDQDSIKAVKQRIEQWAKDKAFELEAMENLESRDELDHLIDNYRSSLLKHLFEKQIIEQKLDSAISKNELMEYYEENKSQYVLKSSISRVLFIKIKKNHPKEDAVRRLWKRYTEPAAMDSLIALCHEVANAFLLEDSSWYKQEELQAIIPGDFIKNGSNGQIKEQIFSNDTSKYFLRILERIPDTEIAPLSFIEKQARKVILYRRKQQLIREWREKIYRDAVKANRVKLYD